jgi:uncharacterized protein (DUF1778 family)
MSRRDWKPYSVKLTAAQLEVIESAARASGSGSGWRYRRKTRSEFMREAALTRAAEVLKAAGWVADGRGGFKAPKL